MPRKYSKGAQDKVEKVMREFKEGKLESGTSGKKVTSRKQAIAIGLSEAREDGEKVPAPKRNSKKSASKNTGSKKTATKKSTAGKSSAKKKAG